jgi:hypothetical protein
MAAPSRDELARGAASMDRAPALPSRPENFPSGRPISLVVDETVPAKHRSRRYRSAHGSSPQLTDEGMGFLASTALAIVSLLFVAAVALGSMLASAAILHVLSPDRRFNTFHALHEPLVIGVLCGLGVLWLLPPYPWATKPAQREPKQRRLFRARAAI